jgi:murein DD-endopeptidase MepM/ murein hydrolase activator NlpD
MNVRRATANFRDTAPFRLTGLSPLGRSVRVRARPMMPYAAALATIVVLALLLSYAARRIMPSVVTVSVADSVGVAGGFESSVAQRERGETRPPRAPSSGARATARAPGVAAAGAAVGDTALTIEGLPPAIEELRRRRLSLPLNGVRVDQLVPTFDEARGDRPHEAIDIMAARGTPVIATEDGRIAKLFWSKAGGHTIYQFDPSERYVYYYAHLDRYADDLAEGQAVTRGQTIGYVGSTGNAKADAPHLHFAIFLLTPEKRWWDGAALDPYPVLRWNVDGGTP